MLSEKSSGLALTRNGLFREKNQKNWKKKRMPPLSLTGNAVSRERRSETSSPESPARRESSEAAQSLVGIDASSERFFFAGKIRRAFLESSRAIQTLHLYGAAGIAAFGWGLSRMLGFSCARWLPLWIAGALLVYNLDRLKHDPTDQLNTPARQRRHRGLRPLSIAVAALSAIALALLSISNGGWLLFFVTLAAAGLSISYSFPLFGFRFKDLPVVKTLFAPSVVLAAYLAPALLARELHFSAALFLAAAWSGCVLLFNMVLCDLRDIRGDRAHGIASIPVLLGENGTRRLLLTLNFSAAFFALLGGWFSLAFVGAIYLAALLFALRKNAARGESFYEWFVEGILFLPAVVELLFEIWKHLADRFPI